MGASAAKKALGVCDRRCRAGAVLEQGTGLSDPLSVCAPPSVLELGNEKPCANPGSPVRVLLSPRALGFALPVNRPEPRVFRPCAGTFFCNRSQTAPLYTRSQ